MALAPLLDLRPDFQKAADHAISNIDAEMALMGSVMFDNQALVTCGLIVRGEHFYEPFLGWLFERAKEMVAKGQLVEPITLHDVAQSGGQAYQELGGIGFLVNMVERAPPAANAPEYARSIFDCYLRRHMLQACTQGAKALVEERERPAFDIIADLRRAVQAVEDDAAPEDASMIGAPDAAALAIATMEDLARNGRTRGLMTGLRCIDRRLNGLVPGAMVVIGGRPGMSKTGLARNMAHGAAKLNRTRLFAFLGLEMSPGEMMQRELAALTQEAGEGIEYRGMASGALTHLDFMAIREAEKRVPPNLVLDDCPALSVDDVRRKVWSLARKGPVGAIFIDYLQLMRRPPANGRNEASVISEMTQGLKLIARQAEICIVVMSQLNRAVEQRDDKRPQLSDLRESGSIEQDADAVLFPFREFYYLQKAEPKASEREKHLEWEMRCEDTRRRLEVICAKQRQGPEGTDRQRYFAEFDLIEDDDG